VLRRALAGVERIGEGKPLALGQRSHRLVLGHANRHQQPPATGQSPSLLAHQQITHLHAVGLPWTAQDHVGDRQVA
jgi:hypothetical protein